MKARMRVVKRRRREGKTDYKKRLKILEGGFPRVVIRKTNKYLILQLVESKEAKDSVRLGLSSKELLKYGLSKEFAGSLKSVPAAYLSGLLFGKKLEKLKLKKVILDLGLIRSTKGSRVYSAVKGIIDSGIELNVGKGVLPEEERVGGKFLKKDFSSEFKKIKERIKNA